MRKSVVCAVAFVALSFLLTGPAPVSAQEYVLEMGTVVPAGSPWALQLKRLKKYIEEQTEGRVKVKLRLGGSNERSLARRTQMGSKQGFAGSVGGLSSIVREVSGANARRDAFNRAVTAGMVRRGYLKGLGQQRGCDYPARPRG